MVKFLGLEIRSAKKAQMERRNYEYNPYGGLLPFGGNLNPSTPSMTLSAVYRATEIISDSIAMLPIYITDKKNEELEGHKLNMVFATETGLCNYYTFMKLLVQSVILKGNGYAYIYRDGNGQPKSLRFVESGEVTVVYNKQRQELYYTCAQVTAGKIKPEDMIHLIKNSWDGVNGVSVLSFAKRTLATAHNTEDSANSFFSNGCNLAGIITVDGILQDKQKEDIRNNWTQAHDGTKNNGCLLGVMQGNMKYQPIQINSADAQMLESRVFNVQDIARFFGISPIMLGDYSQGNSYNSMEAIQQQFLLHTLQPYITIIEQELTRKLAGNSNVRVNLNEAILLKNDKNAQATYFGTLVDKGILTINEVRVELGYPVVEGGDELHIAYSNVQDNTLKDNDYKGDEENQGVDENNEQGKENQENPEDNSPQQKVNQKDEEKSRGKKA